MRTIKKAEFLKRCAELGVKFEDDGSIMSIDAPDGKVFATYYTPYEILHYDCDGWTKAECYRRFMEIMKYGLEDDRLIEN